MIPDESANQVRGDFLSTIDEGPACLVVMYHYVRPATALHCLPPFSSGECIDALTVEAFEAQLDSLCEHFEPISWPQLYAWREGAGDLPRRSFLLTFDDGLADQARYVAPILDRRGLHGTFFISGAVLATQQMLSAHMIHLLLARLGQQRFSEAVQGLLHEMKGLPQDWLRDDSWHGEASRVYYYETPDRARLKYLLSMRLPHAVRNLALRRLFETHIGSPRRWAEDWYLSWEDLVHLQSRGHTVGGHGFSHEPYGRLSDREQRLDLTKTAHVLRDGLGPEMRPFSYPYGSLTDQSAALCRKVGFAHAFTTQERWLTKADDPHLWPRVDTIHVNEHVEREVSCRVTK